MAEAGEPQGVGGWLIFFVVALGLVSPIVTLVSVVSVVFDPVMADAYGAGWAAIQIAEWTLAGLSFLGAWYLIWRLIYIRSWRTVRWVISGIWILTVGGGIFELAIVTYFTGIPIGSLLIAMGPTAVRPFIFCAIWTAYFLCSKRVANTYPRHGGQDQLAEVFG